ncbi:MAG: ribonuclease R [Candidatus Pacebacteria bacterium]|nr:ribonuclease R [Candidatus Paceibacterota bacterium]
MTSQKENTIEGIISVTGRGIGYVTAEGFEQDIEIPEGSLNTALHGDTVEIVLLPKRADIRQQGEVLSVKERARTRFVGTIKRESGMYYLVPDERRMYADIVVTEGAEATPENTKVLVELSEWHDPRKNPHGKVIQVIGKKGEHETEMQAILIGHDVDTSFPADVETQALKIGENREITEEEVTKRRDMREATTFTIDPADAKDFDDALSVTFIDEDTIEVGIHIADVTHYVRPGSAIDEEAQKRGTSIYLVDRTIPMLPEVLSNDVCSLNPNEDKLAFSAVFELNRNAEVKSRWFGRTVIHSDKRFTYQSAQDVLDGASGEYEKELKEMERLAKELRAGRFKEGSIAFESDEVKFELDEKGKPINVIVKERLETMMMIEDFMLLANREVARFLYDESNGTSQLRDTVVYRIHDAPDEEKIQELAVFLKAIGYDLEEKQGVVRSRDINKLLEAAKGKPEEKLIQTATIRSMAKAIYSTKNIGHFSLAFSYYTHFTSPIRRYPDMMVHRILAHYLGGEKVPHDELQRYRRLAIESSQREADAVAAERESIRYKQVEYMQDHVGEMFDGIISGVTDFGVFVEENKTKATGMIRLRDLPDDYYVFDRSKYAVVGERTKRAYRLGDSIHVKLAEASLDDKQLTWKPV